MTEARLTAGVVLWRTAPPTSGDAALEVAVVHRPRYDDWSWPKGGIEAGEHPAVAAAREALEETGYRVALDRSLGTTSYPPAARAGADDPTGRRRGRPTVVRWWSARALGDEPADRDDEVDELRWVTPDAALDLLSYATDRKPLADLVARPGTTSTVLLARHASAGDRKSWGGEDDDRPLDELGDEQARALAAVVGAYAPVRAVTAGPLRCRQTVGPAAAGLGIDVAVDLVWDDRAYQGDPAATTAALEKLAAGEDRVLVCSQGETIPGVLARLADVATQPAAADISASSRSIAGKPVPRSRKGSLWALSFSHGRLTAADYYPTLVPASS